MKIKEQIKTIIEDYSEAYFTNNESDRGLLYSASQLDEFV